MGFKKENYTPKGICVCVYFLLVTNVHSISGQTHCPVRVDYEPKETSQVRFTNFTKEIKFPFFQQWANLSDINRSDDSSASVLLPGNKRSTVFKGQNLGFALPNGSQISGIEILIEGHTNGSGYVEGQVLKLLDKDGDIVGLNYAQKAIPIDNDWKKSNDSTDFVWRYGSSNDVWGLSLSEGLINDQDFGFALQVRNKLNEPVLVSVDHIQMIVYYTPLYEVCSTHACVPFYVDESEDPDVTYEWYIPAGFELISDSEEDAVINIGASYAAFGEYEICVESFYKFSSVGTCCRKFNYLNCEPGLISGQAFFDKNNDSSNNSGDIGIEALLVNLYTNDGTFISSTITDGNGDYSFPNLLAGQYYIEIIDNIDSLVFTAPLVGNPDFDSNITDTFGEGTSELISVVAGDIITNIDAGFNLALTLGNFVWEDLNGDGEQQADEPGIAGIEVILTSSMSATYSQITDSNGFYSFTGLPSGDYAIEFIASSEWIPTIPNNSDDNLDSDFIVNIPIQLSYAAGGQIDSIDAGFFKLSSIGDFVWQDLNKNGLQDDAEPGIPNATLNLLNSNGEVVETAISDSTGYYSFDNIAPALYFIEIQTDEIFTPTEFQIDGGISEAIDSDVFIQDGKLISASFPIISNSNESKIDFGFIEKPASLGGFTYLDGNNDGQFNFTEELLNEINVSLFDTNDNLINSTPSDQVGFFLFQDIPAGSYYLVFELPEDLLFTIENQGDDLSDSDVTNGIVFGSTDIFNLSPDEENYSISAGYQQKAKVGDFIWLDENGNGIQDADEGGLNGITVELFNTQNELIRTTQSSQNPDTDKSGYYLFESLDPEDYYIKVPENELYNFALVDESAVGFNSSITNVNGFGTSNTFSLVGNQCNFDIDAGYALKKGNITGEVWIDLDQDGIQDAEDMLKSEVLISLYDENGTLLFNRNTNEEGQYTFSGLDAGNYYLVFSLNEQYRFTIPLVGSDSTLNSDVTDEITLGSTSFITISDGITIEDIDAGLIDGSVTIDGLTWIDNNGDGILQSDENPLPNVQVELFNLNDSLLASVFTNTTGYYSFENNPTGQYYLVFTPENESFISTAANIGSDDNIDDDITSFFTPGSTDTINLTFFQDLDSISAGYFNLSTIGDQVFIDTNKNGINDDETGINGVFVNLIDDLGNIIGSDTTKQGGGLDSGYYLIENIPPGTYTVQFIRPLFYQFIAADQGVDDNVDSDVVQITNNTGTTNEITISSGTSDLSIDAGLFFQVPAESSIAGTVWDDENANGVREDDELPIPSVEILLVNQNGDIVGMTNSTNDGKYLFDNLMEGFYQVKAVISSDKIATYFNIGQDDSIDNDFLEISGELQTIDFFLATFEDIDNIDLGLVNRLQVGDFVWEDSNNDGTQNEGELGIEEIEITITSQNGMISETVISGADGAYKFENLPAGFYKICADLPSGFNFAKSNLGPDQLDSDVDSSGCSLFIDYTNGGIIRDLDIGLTKNGSIEGIAFVDLNGNGVNNPNEIGLDGIVVSLFNAFGELINSTETTTLDDISGIFKFSNLKATDYYLVFEYPDEFIYSSPNIGDDLFDSDVTGSFGVGSTDLFAVPSGGIVTTISGGAYLPASIGDQVWLDENENGIRDENEAGVAGIDVIVFRSFGMPIDTTKTDMNGIYQFENLKQGLYFIQFVIPQEFSISPADQGVDDDIDSDADNTGKTPLISLAHGADLESVDCGIYSSMASLRSIVWNDSNGDGIRQDEEARVPGIMISLFDPQNNMIASTETNSLGLYAFQDISEGDYKIYVDITETDFAFTSMNMDDDDYHDSDIMATGESEMFASDESSSLLSVPNVDAGLQETGGIVSVVWEDTNADGIYNVDESPFEGVEAILCTSNGVQYRKYTSTKNLDNIQFGKIPAGKYFIKYKVKNGFVHTIRKGETSEDYNSDITNFEGQFISPVFEVTPNEIINHIDAGFYKGAEVSSKIWYDNNINGIQDEENSIPFGVYATLYDTNDVPQGTRGVNQEGKINFSGIANGTYYIKYYSSSILQFTKNISVDELNSDVDHSNGPGTTRHFEFAPYQEYTHIDAGILPIKDWAQKSNALLETEDETELRNNGKDESEELLFEIHPNPAANYIKIEADRDLFGGIITIQNSQNQLVYSEEVKNIERIDLTALHPGIYYVKYKLDDKILVKKLIKIQ